MSRKALFKVRSEVFPLRTRDDALVFMTASLRVKCARCVCARPAESWGVTKLKVDHGDVKMTLGT